MSYTHALQRSRKNNSHHLSFFLQPLVHELCFSTLYGLVTCMFHVSSHVHDYIEAMQLPSLSPLADVCILNHSHLDFLSQLLYIPRASMVIYPCIVLLQYSIVPLRVVYRCTASDLCYYTMSRTVCAALHYYMDDSKARE